MRKIITVACCALLAIHTGSIAAPAQVKAEKPGSTANTRQKFDPQQQVVEIDAVVAVANNEVITRYELDQRVSLVVSQLSRKNIPLPPLDVLERQLLERMIMEKLQAQFASESGVRVDDSQLELAITRIAQSNGFSSIAEFRTKRLDQDGISYQVFREEIRKEMIFTRLREREVDSKIIISDSEVDNYLANKARQGSAGEEYRLAHIMVGVPEQASAEKIQSARARAEKALAQLKAGADFAQIAAGFSDAEDALKGGDLGWRKSDRIPPLFMNELQTLQAGQITAVLRSPSGFHILKLVAKRSGTESVVITQTHARHILIKTSEIVSEREAQKRLMEIKQRIESGADFAEQARRYSQDGSAQQGGDLDWISPGQTVPEFEDAMDELRPGQIGVAQTQFGWHLIQVLERRNTDISEQQKRQQAYVAIGTFKSDEQYQEWLRQLRDRAFVEYRLENASAR